MSLCCLRDMKIHIRCIVRQYKINQIIILCKAKIITKKLGIVLVQYEDITF